MVRLRRMAENISTITRTTLRISTPAAAPAHSQVPKNDHLAVHDIFPRASDLNESLSAEDFAEQVICPAPAQPPTLRPQQSCPASLVEELTLKTRLIRQIRSFDAGDSIGC